MKEIMALLQVSKMKCSGSPVLQLLREEVPVLSQNVLLPSKCISVPNFGFEVVVSFLLDFSIWTVVIL